MNDDIRKSLADVNEEVRRQGAQMISSLVTEGKATSKALKEAVALYDIALGDESWRVRKVAAEGLLSMRDTEEVVHCLFGALESQDNAGKRNAAQETLISMGGRVLTLLLKRMEHKDREVRKFIADILGEIGDASAAPAIAKKLLWDEDENVRVAAAEALGKIGKKEAMSSLLKVLKKGGGLMLLYTVLESLGKLGKKGYSIPITPLIKGLKDPILRRGALDALGWSRNPRAISHLVTDLDDDNKAVREASLIALVNLSSSLTGPAVNRLKKNVRADVAGDAYERIEKSLESCNIDVQKAAIRVLGWIGRESAVVPLVAVGSLEETLRDSVCLSIEEIGEKALRTLLEAFPGLGSGARALVMKALGGIRGDGVEEVLLSSLTDDEPSVRTEASLSLGRRYSTGHAPPAVVSALIMRLDDSEEETRRAAAQALLLLEGSSHSIVIDALTHLPPRSSVTMKKNSLEIIGRIGGKKVLEHLFFNLKDESPEVRRSALQALGDLGYKESIEYIRVTLADEDPQVRVASARTLGEIGGARVIDSLVLALTDEDPQVRCAVLRGLRGIQGPGPEDAIRGALSDTHPLVAITAIGALRERGEGEFLKGLRKMLSHPADEVRREALRYLARINGKESLNALSLLSKDQDPVIREEAQRLAKNFPATGRK